MSEEVVMRFQLMVIGGATALLALVGCHGAPAGGGGGQQNHISLNNSNPITQQEERTGALALQAMPDSGSAKGPSHITVLSRNGKPLARMDVNTASASELMRIPGMSHGLAQAIVTNRPYHNRQELITRIPRLSPELASAFDPYLTYNPAPGGGAGMAP
jgi:hypothetical protein